MENIIISNLLLRCFSLSNPHITIVTPTLIIVVLLIYLWIKPVPVYLVDFACYRPPDSLRVPESHFIEHSEAADVFDQESLDFQEKVLWRSGIGSEACMPISVHEMPPGDSFDVANAEIEQVLFTIVEDLLSKRNINPKTIDILVTNCSLFCPTPSISSMIINRFGFRSDVRSVSLGGMGCSAGILAISLAKDLLRVHQNSLALVLSMEAVSPNGYTGKEKSMLIANILFRMGGAAILLSNRKKDKSTAKYELRHLVRTHTGSGDQAYQSVFQDEDDDGKVGVSISRSLLHVASKALKINVSKLGPLVLPYSEQLRYAWMTVWRRVRPPPGGDNRRRGGGGGGLFVPNFKKAFEHFCIHAGGRGVIDGLEENLKLEKEDGEASRMTLYRFGNTSSSSVWYELCYLEAKGKMKKGDRVWQIAFGSGFKCNSAVWKCISHIDPNELNAWSDRISLFPVQIPNGSH